MKDISDVITWFMTPIDFSLAASEHNSAKCNLETTDSLLVAVSSSSSVKGKISRQMHLSILIGTGYFTAR